MYSILLVLWGLLPLTDEPPQCRCEAATVCAGESCRELDLDQLLALVDGLPELEAAKALEAAAVARAQGAGRLPNPELFGEFEDLGLSNPAFSRSQTTLGLTQELPLGGRRGAQTKSAQLEARQAALDLAATRRLLGTEAAALFFETLAEAQRLNLLAAAQEEARRELLRLRQREGLGEGAGHETLAWEAELSSTCGALLEECDRYQQQLAALAGLLGEPDWQRLRPVGTLRRSQTPPASVQPDKQAWPELEAASVGVQQARANLEHQHSLAIPDVAIGAGLRGLDGFDGQTLVFSIALPLPVFDRNQASIGDAAAQLRRAQAIQRQVAIKGTLKAAQLAQRLEAVRVQLERLHAWTQPALERLVKALGLRQAGTGGELAALMGARERLLEARLRELELQTEARRIELEQSLLTGTEVSHE
jgi:cobalt-zinc-cadmium efflux system outer membrane protein